MNKIVIVDDDCDSRENLAIVVEDAGFEVDCIEGRYGNDKQHLIDEILSKDAYGVISDHRLSPGQLASFTGSELLASLYDERIPSILITQFLDVDADSTIRMYREKLPAVIGRGEQDHLLIRDLLLLSRNELEQGRSFERKPHRAIIRIENYRSHMNDGILEGVIVNWNSKDVVRFPCEIIPQQVRNQIQSLDDFRLMAFVNTGAEDQKDIYISNIHLASSVRDLDELF